MSLILSTSLFVADRLNEMLPSHLIFRTIKENHVEKVIHAAVLNLPNVNSNPLLGIKVNCEGIVCVLKPSGF